MMVSTGGRKERRCSRRLLRKSKLQHLRVARVRAASSTSWTIWGLGGTGGAALLREAQRTGLVSIQPGAGRSGGWRAPTATGRLRPGPGGSGGWCITLGHDVLDCLGLLLYRRELLGKALDGVAEQPRLGDGGERKRALSTSFISARLSQRWRS